MTLLTKRNVVVASSVAALGAGGYTFYELLKLLTRRDIISAEIPGYLIQRLYELRDDEDNLQRLQRLLKDEWVYFAPANMAEMRLMADNAGKMILALRKYKDGILGPPIGVLQTARANAHGDPKRLVKKYPTFDRITRNRTWEGFNAMEGDTIVLLQITIDPEERRGGAGSKFRDAALYMLPGKYAITTTPHDKPKIDFDLNNPSTYTGSIIFHYRGGAKVVWSEEGYKKPDPSLLDANRPNPHSEDIVFMLYECDKLTNWIGVERPDMRLIFSEPYYRKYRKLVSSFHWPRILRQEVAFSLSYSFQHLNASMS